MTDSSSLPIADTFPRQYARTRRLSLGEPRTFRAGRNGTRITFLRSLHGSDPVQRLWVLDEDERGRWTERLAVDPLSVDATDDGELPDAERARRERQREQADGITAYDVDRTLSTAVFTLAGRLFVTDLDAGTSRSLPAAPGAYDPRIAPDGAHVAYVCDGALHVVDVATGVDRVVADDPDEAVNWGIADFNAAEEFDRYRGFWWSPDSRTILAERVDDTPLQSWWIADPANPNREPRQHRYPKAGTANALLELALFDVASLERTSITWSHDEFPYLVDVVWNVHGCTAVLMNRAQTVQRYVDIALNGTLRRLHEERDDTWVEKTSGTPLRLADGRFLLTSARQPGNEDPEGTQTLIAVTGDGTVQPLTPANVQVRRIVGLSRNDGLERALLVATLSGAITGLENHRPDPGAQVLLEAALDGSGVRAVLRDGADVGVHDVAAVDEATAVVRSASTNRPRAQFTVHRNGIPVHSIDNLAETALVHPKPHFFIAGTRPCNTAVLLPSDHARPDGGGGKLPVLLDPYGGPHAQRVVQARNAHATSQWFADQGFAVVVIDGRGTPGIGPRYERAVRDDLALPVLEDQVTGLYQAAERFPQLDLTRVGIRGWSFGGYLAALAVLERPDVFHAAVAGAPVTEWRLYDSGYTERYLGHPDEQPAVYDHSGLLGRAHKLTRPLMIVHGLADDNVVAAHTLQLSSALLAHGKPHEVLPLSGVTHMTPQEVVAENLLLLQVEFLKRHLDA